jgi:long-chain acyl-CoA synthetase
MIIFDGKNIPDIFHRQSEMMIDRICVAYKKNNAYIEVTWREMQYLVLSFAHNLKKNGIRKGDRVAIFSPNRFEWWIVDLAILTIGAVAVPIYATNSAEEAQFILNNSGSKCCIAGGKECLKNTLSVIKKVSSLSLVISLDHVKKTRSVVWFGEMLSADDRAREAVRAGVNRIKFSDIATIIYTSGTTGSPKGVVLTHGNIVQDITNTLHDIPVFFNTDDIFLSFLPLSHVLERVVGCYAMICIGTKVVFAEDVSKLLDSIKEVRPTALICVPRIYEKMHAGIMLRLKTASIVKKLMFAFASSIASKNLKFVCAEKKRPLLFDLMYRCAEKLVFSKVKKALGFDRMKSAVSGGGPLSVSDAEFFVGMGIRILEGFGLTETSPITHFNRPGEIIIGSVGRAIPETDVQIADDGEILFKGPQVMKGYFRDSAATKEAFDKNGYFKTGDIGRIDENGVLYITGRKKDIFVTSGGKNISPQNIENKLKGSPYVEQVALIGDRRKFISALIVPDFKELEKWASLNKVTWRDRESAIADPRVMRMFEKEIERLTVSCSRVEKVKRFALLSREWTQDSGEMTPSHKVKRHVIEEKYAGIIEGIYHEDDRPRR